MSEPLLRKAYLGLDEVRATRTDLEITTPLLDGEEGIHLFLGPDGIRPVRVGSGTRVVRIYAPAGVLDLATGLFHPGAIDPADLRHFWLAGMPL